MNHEIKTPRTKDDLQYIVKICHVEVFQIQQDTAEDSMAGLQNKYQKLKGKG